MASSNDPMVVFPEVVRFEFLHEGVPHELERDEQQPRWVLRMPRRSESGFDVGVTCETYGLYVWADGWHGTPWDFTPQGTVEAVCRQGLRFARRLLTPEARVRTLESSGKPYRWMLELQEGGEWILYEETGLLLFNYFGRRTERVLCNGPA